MPGNTIYHLYYQAACGANPNCSAFTWLSSENSHTPLFCFLFHSTSSLTSCSDCISGPVSCTCSSNTGCQVVGDNVIDVANEVSEEVMCQDLCASNHLCTFYTWYDETHAPPFTCILFSDCSVEDDTCSGCFSGPPHCGAEAHSPGEAEVLFPYNKIHLYVFFSSSALVWAVFDGQHPK